MNTIPIGCIAYDFALLVSVRVSRAGSRIEECAAYPEVPAWLEEQRRRGFRLGVCVDPESIPHREVVEALRRAGILGYLDPGLLFIGPRSSLPPPGPIACPHDKLVVVDTDAGERSRIRGAGLLSAPHPALAEAVLGGEKLRFLRIRVPPRLARANWRALLRGEPLVPLYISDGLPDGHGPVVYAIADEGTAARLNGPGSADFEVKCLGEPEEPQWSDVLVVTRDEEDPGLAPAPGKTVLDPVAEGFLVAVAVAGPEHPGLIPPRYFHSRKLVPSTCLWEPCRPLGPSPLPTGAEQGRRILGDEERDTIRRWVRPEAIKRVVDRYSGAAPLRWGVTIVSRELKHRHNRTATCSLAADLARLGRGRLSVRLHPFTNATIQCANVEATLPRSGLGGAVIVCAHLDSTVDPKLPGSGPHDPERDPAPGADDNASGVAGVLCAARALLRLAGGKMMHREIRFLLFNSEEKGVAGSLLYALDRRQMCDDITAVFNMDMIGYDGVPPRAFEVHAGGANHAEVLARSGELARLVTAVAPEVSEGELHPQFYLGVSEPDPASGYSDHSSFHSHGFPACLVSEDYSKDLVPYPPKPDRTPGYHRRTDTIIHSGYAADIARSVAAAAWVAATRVG